MLFENVSVPLLTSVGLNAESGEREIEGIG